MFSVWPELFAYQLVAITLLRVAMGYLFLVLGARGIRAHMRDESSSPWIRRGGIMYGSAQLIVGGLLLAGLCMQPAALAGALLVTLPTLTRHSMKACEQHLHLVLFVLSLSLLFLGPGLFAFDVPL